MSLHNIFIVVIQKYYCHLNYIILKKALFIYNYCKCKVYKLKGSSIGRV